MTRQSENYTTKTTYKLFRDILGTQMEAADNTKHHIPIITTTGNYDINNTPLKIKTKLSKHAQLTLADL